MERTNAGRLAAKEKDVKFGRRKISAEALPEELNKYYKAYAESRKKKKKRPTV